MVAGESERKNRLCLMKRAAAQSVEDGPMNERIGLGERSLLSRGPQSFPGKPASPINLPNRPKHQGKKSHDDERQVQR